MTKKNKGVKTRTVSDALLRNRTTTLAPAPSEGVQLAASSAGQKRIVDSVPINVLVISSSPSLADGVAGLMRGKAVQVKSRWRPISSPPPQHEAKGVELILCPESLRGEVEQLRLDKAPQAEIITLPDAADTDMPMLDDDSLVQRCIEAAAVIRERDIVGRLRHQIEILQSRLRRLEDEGGVAEADIEGGVITRASKSFVELLGAGDWDEVEATPLLDWVAPDDQPQVKSSLKAVAGRGVLPSSLKFAVARDPRRTVRFAMSLNEADGERVLQLACAPGQQGATADGVFAARRRLKDKLAEWPGHEAGLVHLWIVDFNELEMRAGHDDAAMLADLLDMALMRLVGEGNEVFRFGLDEYVVWLNGDETAVKTRAAALLDRVGQQTFEAGPLAVQLRLSSNQVTLSGEIQTESLLKALRHDYLQRGVSEADPPGDDADMMEASRIDRLVNAMHRNFLNLATLGGAAFSGAAASASAPAAPDPQVQHEADAQGSAGAPNWRHRILDSLKHDRFRLALQSISPLESGSRTYEALVQLVAADGTQHRLREFRDQAETSGLLGAIDRWAIGQTLKRLAEPGTRRSQIFLKLSRNTIDTSGEFLRWLETLLGGNSSLARYLVFEVTEANVTRAPDAVAYLFEQLRGMGLETGVFAAHGAAADLLPQLGITWLRLSSRVHGYVRNEDARPPEFRAMLEYAREHDIRLVAPDRGAAALVPLWQWGVQYIQAETVETEARTD